MGGKRACLLSLVLLMGLLHAAVWGQENVLINGEFGTGLDGWSAAGATGYEVRVVQDAGLSGDNAVVVDVTDQAATDQISLSGEISNLVRGRSYPLSFIAMAEVSRQMVVSIELYTPSRTILLSETVQLSETPKLFTFQYYHSRDSLSSHSSWTASINFVVKSSGMSMMGDELNAMVWVDSVNLGGQAASFEASLARNAQPADGADDVRRDVMLEWTPGSSAVMCDVYFGTSDSSVSSASRSSTRGVLVSRGQYEDSCEIGGSLDLGQTYYWRVDSVGSLWGQNIVKGDVWSFTAEPEGYPIEGVSATASHANPGRGIENTIDGSGLDNADRHSTTGSDMWLAAPGSQTLWVEYEFDQLYKLYQMCVWNYNADSDAGLRDVTVSYSSNGSNWTTLQDVEFNRASESSSYTSNTTVAFGGVAARYVRLVVHSNWNGGNSYGLSEVRFLSLPSRSREPFPADGADDCDLDMVLSWRSGRKTQSHRVYLGVSRSAVANGWASVATVTNNRYDPGRFDLGTRYYWRVDQIDSDTGDLWQGDVWSFSTEEYSLIEGFEDYTDDTYNEETIWQTWIDGVDDTGNGHSVVGYDTSPFAEQSIVHGGEQSMPLSYDNSDSPYYSETYRVWETPQNWTAGAADTLRLYFRGDPTNAAERLYVAIEDNAGRTKVVRHSSSNASRLAGWQVWTIPLSTLSSAGLNITSISAMIIGVGDRNNPTPGGSGMVCIDDIAIGSSVD